MSDSASLSREELINEEFDRLFHDTHGDRICRNCWRLLHTQANYPSAWVQEHEHTFSQGETAKAVTGTRERVQDNTERDHGSTWCQWCGSNASDQYDSDSPNDLSVENFPEKDNHYNFWTDSVGLDRDAEEYSHIDFEAHDQRGEHVNVSAISIGSHVARNFCQTAAFLRWSSGPEDPEIPRFSTVGFMGSFLRILKGGEATKITTALRYAFADAVVSFRTAHGTEWIDLTEEARYVGSRPSIPDPIEEESSEESAGPSRSPYRSAWK